MNLVPVRAGKRFKKRFNVASLKLQGEAAFADKSAAEDHVSDTFKTIIEEGVFDCVVKRTVRLFRDQASRSRFRGPTSGFQNKM